MDTPLSLLKRLRQPAAETAWSQFVELYTPLLFCWARRVGLQEPDAADLVQEVFAVLVQTLPTFAYDDHRSFRGWLRTVTLNKWRERARRPTPATVDGDLSDLGDLGDVTQADPAEAFWEEDYRRHLTARALQLMQADFQPATWQACWAMVAEEKPAAQVARELGLSVGAVYAAKFRVLSRLRQELGGLLE